MREKLPSGWVQTNALEIAEPIRGVTYSKNQARHISSSGFTAILRANNIQNDRLDLSNLIFVPDSNVSDKQRLLVNDIIFAMSSGSASVVGKSAQVKEPTAASFGAFCGVLRPTNQIDPKYIGHFFKSDVYRKSISQLARGVNINNLKWSHFEQIPIPLSPLAEQKRIADKLDALLAKVDSCKARLDKVPGIIKQFRQAVLAAATSGKLTEEWRRERNDNKKIKSMPLGWRWIELEDVIPKGGIFDGPFGSNLKTADYKKSGVRVIRLENIGHLSFNSQKESFISTAKYSALIKHTVGQGDIIFSSFINDEIRACILPYLGSKAIAKADCFTIRPDEKAIDKKYLLYNLVCKNAFDQLTKNIHGVTRPRINTSHLRALKIRFCPISEQHEIVTRVDKLFSYADAFQQKLSTVQENVRILTASILAKALKGELVPQDPDDEPAEKLIERIKMEKEKLKGKVKKNSLIIKGKIRTKGLINSHFEIRKTVHAILKEAKSPISAKELWQQSNFSDNIDRFYAELKKIEDQIVEIKEGSTSKLSLKK